MAGSRLDLAALERLKDKGVPTLTDLSRDFRGSSTRCSTPNGAAGRLVVDRLLAGAKSIVRVRKTDARQHETSAEALVARMEAALKDGRLGEVMDEAKKLSPKAQAAGQAVARARSRRAQSSIRRWPRSRRSSRPRSAPHPRATGGAER